MSSTGSVCEKRLPTGFAQRVKDEGGVLIRKTGTREEILRAALAPIENAVADGTRSAPPTDAELVADFLALGYCYLQIDLLTRQMRYASNLDETYFKGTAIAAAVAAVEGNADLAREKLSACFSVLAEERDHYYPVDAFVLDLTLTAATTLGEPLREALSRDWPTTVLISADLLAEMAAIPASVGVMLPEDATLLDPEALAEPSSGELVSRPENPDATIDSCVPDMPLPKVITLVPAL